MSSTRSHWETVYGRRPYTTLSWYQAQACRSLALLEAFASPRDALVDVGGGASVLVDDLLARGFEDLTVLDVSAAALDVSRQRLGESASRVRWIEADITTWRPERRYDAWHDRAVFHFMTTHERQEAYLAALRAGTAAGALVIVATFAPDGPQACSGLPVQRYDAEGLARRFGPDFALLERADEVHETPGGAAQKFCFAVLRRVGGGG